MDNFCPNCGKPLEPNSKFCPYCGQRLENELSINSGDSDVKLKSRQGIKKSGIIILFLLLFIVGAGAVGFYIYHNKQQNIAAVNKMPKKDLAGLSIVYAHNHYKNPAWDKTYDEALKGNIVVQRTKQIDINGATITAKGNSYIYVINNRVVFTTDKNKKNSDSKLVLSDGKRTLGQVNTIEAYNEVKKNNLKQLNKINRIRQVPAVPVRKLAIMAALSHAKSNDLEESIDLNLKDHSTDLYNGGEYYRLQLGADGGSATEFKIDGDMVTVKYLDLDKAADEADAPTKKIRIQLQDLLEEYYQTNEQKEYVDKLASKLTPDKSIR